MISSVEINAGDSLEVAGVKVTVKEIAMHSEGDGPAVQRVSLDVETATQAQPESTPRQRQPKR